MDTQLFLLVVAGILTGLFSGLFGVGGGIILIPLMVLFGVPIHQAVGLSLVYVLLTSLSGTLAHMQKEKIKLSISLLLALGASISVHWGTRAAHGLSDKVLSLSFGILIFLILGLFFLKTRMATLEKAETESQTAFNFMTYLRVIIIGLVAGWFSGMFGIGGGFVIVPLLVIFTHLSMKQGVGISLGAIILISAIGILQHFWHGMLKDAILNYQLAILLMGVGGAFTARLGANLGHRLPEKHLRYSFILFAVLAGSYMVFKGV